MFHSKGRWVSRDEFIRDRANKISEIFGPAAANPQREKGQRDFVNPTWQTALIPDTVLRYSADLADAYVPEPATSDEVAHKVIWPRLLQAIGKLDASPIVLTDIEVGPFPETQGALLLDPENTQSARAMLREVQQVQEVGTYFMLFTLYDQTARWGLTGNEFDNVSVLGGDAEFMNGFFQLCGGKQVLRDVFEQYAQEEALFDDIRETYAEIWSSLTAN